MPARYLRPLGLAAVAAFAVLALGALPAPKASAQIFGGYGYPYGYSYPFGSSPYYGFGSNLYPSSFYSYPYTSYNVYNNPFNYYNPLLGYPYATYSAAYGGLSSPYASYGYPYTGYSSPFASYGYPSSLYGSPYASYGYPSMSYDSPYAGYGSPYSTYAMASPYGAPTAAYASYASSAPASYATTGSYGSGATGAYPTTGDVAVASSMQAGAFLVAGGWTLYTLSSDRTGSSSCTGACATTWPPFMASAGSLNTEAGIPGTFGTITRSDGTQQVTYNGKPLYFYSGDSGPGMTNGQGVTDQWGTWSVAAE
jgi:predicted lipoprotein with Yx(FWY)xxD motif